jgi:hypothetical protein
MKTDLSLSIATRGRHHADSVARMIGRTYRRSASRADVPRRTVPYFHGSAVLRTYHEYSVRRYARADAVSTWMYLTCATRGGKGQDGWTVHLAATSSVSAVHVRSMYCMYKYMLINLVRCTSTEYDEKRKANPFSACTPTNSQSEIALVIETGGRYVGTEVRRYGEVAQFPLGLWAPQRHPRAAVLASGHQSSPRHVPASGGLCKVASSPPEVHARIPELLLA